jgi:secreted trypsin-like serine protease
MTRAATLAILAFSLGCGDQVVPPLGRAESAIRGGATDTTHDAVVALVMQYGQNTYGLCTGTVIHVGDDTALVLTAAHCLVQMDALGEPKIPPAALGPHQVLVAIGRTITPGAGLHAAAVTVHPAYDGFIGTPNDLATVRLNGNGAATLPVIPALAPADDTLDVGSMVTLVGYGDNDQSANDFTRRFVEKPVKWLNAQFLGFDQTDGHGACHGDSGGPALVTVGGAPAVAGVASFVKGSINDDCNSAFTSTRLGPHADFLARAIADMSTPDSGGGCTLAPGRPSPVGLLLLLACLLGGRRRRR